MFGSLIIPFLEKVYFGFYKALRAMGNDHDSSTDTGKLFFAVFFIIPFGLIFIIVFEDYSFLEEYFATHPFFKRIVAFLLILSVFPVTTKFIIKKNNFQEKSLNKYDNLNDYHRFSWRSRILAIFRGLLLLFWSIIFYLVYDTFSRIIAGEIEF